MSGIAIALLGAVPNNFSSVALVNSTGSDTNVGYNSTFTQVQVSFNFRSYGVITRGAIGTGSFTGSTTWGEPANPFSGAKYSILCTPTGGTGGTFFNPATSWATLDVDRSISLGTSSSTPGTYTGSRTATIQIRRNSDLVVLTTATFTWSYSLTVNSGPPP